MEPVFRVPNGVLSWTIDCSPDNRFVAAGLEDGSIYVFELATGELQTTFKSRRSRRHLRFHPNRNWLAVASSGRVEIYDLKSGESLGALEHPQANMQVEKIDWSPDGRCLATACEDFRGYIWHVEESSKGRLVAFRTREMIGHPAEVKQIAFHPLGGLVSTFAWDGTTRLWDMTGNELLRIEDQYPKISRNGPQLLTSNGRRNIALWELSTAQVRILPDFTHSGKTPGHVQFSSDGRLLAVSGRRGVSIVSVATGNEIAFLKSKTCWTTIFLPEGDALLTCSLDGLHRWPILQDKTEFSVGPKEPLSDIKPFGRASISADGKTLVVVHKGMSGAYVFDLSKGEANRGFQLKQPGLNDVSISADGRWIAAGCFHGQSGVRIWDAHSKQEVQKLIENENNTSVLFSPDGKWLVTGTGGEYRFWKVVSNRWHHYHTIPRVRAGNVAGRMAFSSNGRMLAIAHTGRIIRLIDVGSCKEVATLEPPNPETLTWIGFSPDGSNLQPPPETVVFRSGT